MLTDVEGFEIRALRGALRAIGLSGVGAILVEIASYRRIYNNITIIEGISLLEHVTSLGHYSAYIIARNDFACPRINVSNIDGMIEVKTLTLMNMSDGQLQFASEIYQFLIWKNMITSMLDNQ